MVAVGSNQYTGEMKGGSKYEIINHKLKDYA